MRHVRVRETSLAVGALVVAILFVVGAWSRRWIADDGLIVLRTVENLSHGNGPVFNAGERVEVNTSTMWTYLLWLASWAGHFRPEQATLAVSLALSAVAVVMACVATARLHRARSTVLIPVGVVAYVALPPARDFATSGLEVPLCLLWVAALWWALTVWSTTVLCTRTAVVVGVLAGLAPLVRPELAIAAAVAVVLVLATPAQGWVSRVVVIVCAAVLPVAYQIFRMGYYGVVVPNTAIAKEGATSKWGEGWHYLTNFSGTYWLVVPVILAVVVGGCVYWSRSRSAERADDDHWLHSPRAVVIVMVAGGIVEALYWLRQGGDFMHARVLLVPLFMLLLPIAVVPITRRHLSIGARVVLPLAAVAMLVWSACAAVSPGMHNGPELVPHSIVDERAFYVRDLGRSHPVDRVDYAHDRRMVPLLHLIADRRGQNGVFILHGDHDWAFVPQSTGPGRGIAVQIIMLGMTSSNLPLSVKVYDPIGLADPLAAHTERIDGARIGHDKSMPVEWVLARAGAIPGRSLPGVYSKSRTVRAAADLHHCPRFASLERSYTAPLTLRQFLSNIKHAYSNTNWRFDAGSSSFHCPT